MYINVVICSSSVKEGRGEGRYGTEKEIYNLFFQRERKGDGD